MKRTKGIGFGKFYFKSQQETMAGTKKVRTNKEWHNILNGELGEKLDLPKF